MATSQGCLCGSVGRALRCQFLLTYGRASLWDCYSMRCGFGIVLSYYVSTARLYSCECFNISFLIRRDATSADFMKTEAL
jgi:hypothetical protein